MGERALVAMSGGVDSSVAAFLMKEKGYEPIGATMLLIESGGSKCCTLEDIDDARTAARKLGIPHYVFDCTREFTLCVIEPFIECYEKGETPNPCIECNRHLKFSLLMHRAIELEANMLATGHYARIEKSGSRLLLKKGKDSLKDQSYVLYTMTQESLSRTCFPLGSLAKNEVREIARSLGFDNAEKKESQDICFVPGGDYGAFMEKYTGKLYPEGDILDVEGRLLGRHKGIVRYTLGQRKGLGVAANVPVYVKAKNTQANTITLGGEDSLYTKTLTARNINLIACGSMAKPLRVMAKTRYLQQEKPALAEQTGPDEFRLEFDEGQRALTPGQAAVLYDGDTVIGGGTIVSSC